MVGNDPAAQFERVPLVAAGDSRQLRGRCCSTSRSRRSTTSNRTASGRRRSRWTSSICRLSSKLDARVSLPRLHRSQPRTVDPGGDIAAIKGTEVRLKVTPTMATPGGRVMLNENESLPLTKQADGTLAANFTVSSQGFYRIELEGPQGEKVNASPQVHHRRADRSGAVGAFNKPGRDTNASPVEEVFAEVRADDDFGVKQLQMFYSVNGGAEKTDARCSAARRRCPR